MIHLKIFFLLLAINLAPPLLTYYLDERWNRPVDFGLTLRDGNRLFGGHKTIRGIVIAALTGALVSTILGLGVVIGFLAALLSMAGDLTSSFIKRRLSLDSGHDVPGLDQGLEGFLPLMYLKYSLDLSFLSILFLLTVFCFTAYWGSTTYKKLLYSHLPHNYPRRLKPRTRFKEIASCTIRSTFWRRFFNFEDAIYYHLLIQTFFKATGLYERGVFNALNFETREVTFTFDTLPESFDGFTILFITDLHLDGLPGLTERLITLLPNIKTDLCILGGDYRMATHGSCSEANRHLRHVLSSITADMGIMAVLGNHDCLDMVEALEESGAIVLLNSSRPVRKNGQTIWISGVDDPHYYRCHDLDMAFEDVPDEAFSIFVAHSPRLYREASLSGADLYLAGHTHGGQVHVPPIGPVFTHCPAPIQYCLGSWEYNAMSGYTSYGVGVSGVPVRFNCPGEIVTITLRRRSGTCTA